MEPVVSIEPKCRRLNETIASKFRLYSSDPEIIKSHYFAGRFENIYIPIYLIPELQVVFNKLEGIIKSEGISACDELLTGFWFNEMRPGDITTLHNHDDYDEIISGVYYVTVPANSGNLIIHMDNKAVEVTPEEGMFVLFSPANDHEVQENKSNSTRLSIGFNVRGGG